MPCTITLIPADGGGFLAVCPQLPEVLVFAETEEEALARVHRKIEEALKDRQLIGKPTPSLEDNSDELFR